QVVLARPSDPMSLFRGVDKNEKHREGSGREPGRLGWEGSRPREQRIQVRCSRDAEPSSTARPAQVLDCAEGLVARQPTDDTTQRRRKPPHVLAERCVLGPGYGR